MWGAGLRAAAQHSQSLLPVFTHIPGLKVAAPSNPYDAKGLLIAVHPDNDPVIFAEHKMLYSMVGEVPEESYAIPFGCSPGRTTRCCPATVRRSTRGASSRARGSGYAPRASTRTAREPPGPARRVAGRAAPGAGPRCTRCCPSCGPR